MFKMRSLLPALLLLATVPAVCQAQLSVPLTTTKYQVQVQYEFWRSGGTYWSTVFETEDHDDAELMYDLLFMAHESGDICDIFDCNFNWIITDVRLVVKTTLNYRFTERQNRWTNYRPQSSYLYSPRSKK